MSNVHLPRPLSDYFAFNEEEAGGDRRYSLYFPYRPGGSRVEHLRWVWRIAAADVQQGGAELIAERRRLETQRFAQIIHWWLGVTGQALGGDEPIPLLSRIARHDAPGAAANDAASASMPDRSRRTA